LYQSKRETESRKGLEETPKKSFTWEQIVAKLRQIEVLLSQGKSVPFAYKEGGITELLQRYRPTQCDDEDRRY